MSGTRRFGVMAAVMSAVCGSCATPMNAGREHSGMTRELTIQNGVARTDAQGLPVDAHDGCLHWFEGRYYLYGTAYGATDGFGKTNRYRCYSSSTLSDWTLEGNLIENPPDGVYYRPYVAFNRRRHAYVLWYNWYPTLWNGQYGVATSSRPQGPYGIVNPNARVPHAKPGDHGLFVDDDGTGYLVYTSIELEHAISIVRLSDDYLSATDQQSEILARHCEAPAMFRRGATYYVVFGNLCCFCPQGAGAQVFMSERPLGPYRPAGDINRDDAGRIIIPAQQTHIALLPAAGASATDRTYVWMGDLWGSQPNERRGACLQAWLPLRFDTDGRIHSLADAARWTLPGARP